MPYQPRSYAEIAAARKARIVAGENLHDKGRCFYCDYPQKTGLFCSKDCADSYHAERAESSLAGG